MDVYPPIILLIFLNFHFMLQGLYHYSQEINTLKQYYLN